MCQCPIAGLPHFYCLTEEASKIGLLVSMPYSGLTSFLPEEDIETLGLLKGSVNAL